MTRADRIVELLDNALQTSSERSYGTELEDGACVRCCCNPAAIDSSWCEPCRQFLLSDEPVELPRQPAPYYPGPDPLSRMQRSSPRPPVSELLDWPPPSPPPSTPLRDFILRHCVDDPHQVVEAATCRPWDVRRVPCVSDYPRGQQTLLLGGPRDGGTYPMGDGTWPMGSHVEVRFPAMTPAARLVEFPAPSTSATFATVTYRLANYCGPQSPARRAWIWLFEGMDPTGSEALEAANDALQPKLWAGDPAMIDRNGFDASRGDRIICFADHLRRHRPGDLILCGTAPAGLTLDAAHLGFIIRPCIPR